MTNGIEFLLFILGFININNSNIVRADGGKIWNAMLLELQEKKEKKGTKKGGKKSRDEEEKIFKKKRSGILNKRKSTSASI